MTSRILDEIFPDSTVTAAVPCGTGTCVPTTIQIIARDGGRVNQTASNAAIESLRDDINRSLAAVEEVTIKTIDNSVVLLAINIYIPIFLVLIIIIWVLCAINLLSTTATVVITVLLIIIAVIFIFLIRASISSYLTQQLNAIRGALTDYFISEDFINALNRAACVYNSIAGGTTPPILRVRSCSACKIPNSVSNNVSNSVSNNVSKTNSLIDEYPLSNIGESFVDVFY